MLEPNVSKGSNLAARSRSHERPESLLQRSIRTQPRATADDAQKLFDAAQTVANLSNRIPPPAARRNNGSSSVASELTSHRGSRQGNLKIVRSLRDPPQVLAILPGRRIFPVRGCDDAAAPYFCACLAGSAEDYARILCGARRRCPRMAPEQILRLAQSLYEFIQADQGTAAEAEPEPPVANGGDKTTRH